MYTTIEGISGVKATSSLDSSLHTNEEAASKPLTWNWMDTLIKDLGSCPTIRFLTEEARIARLCKLLGGNHRFSFTNRMGLRWIMAVTK